MIFDTGISVSSCRMKVSFIIGGCTQYMPGLDTPSLVCNMVYCMWPGLVRVDSRLVATN